MKQLIIAFISVFVLGWGISVLWRMNTSDARSEKQELAPSEMLAGQEHLLQQIKEEIESARNTDNEAALLQSIEQTGLLGSELDERLRYEERWLDELKVFLYHHLSLEIRYYLDYVELKNRLYQKMIRERENLKKRYGTGERFTREWAKTLPSLLTPYREDLEGLFEGNYAEIVKFNQLFNEKIKQERYKEYKDFPVVIPL